MRALRILIVDDAVENAELLEEYLQSFGHNVDKTYNGEKAILLISKNDYDIVVTDVLMPRKDGFEVAKFIKENHPGIYVIAMSGGSAMIPRNMALQGVGLYADDTLKKPFAPDELKAKIELYFTD